MSDEQKSNDSAINLINPKAMILAVVVVIIAISGILKLCSSASEVGQDAKALAETAYQKGLACEAQKDLAAAKDHYKIAAETDPNNTLYMNKLGDICFDLEEYQKALEAYETALETEQKHKSPAVIEIAHIQKKTGITFLKIKKYKKAIGSFNVALKTYKSIQEDKEVVECFNHIGHAWSLAEKNKKGCENAKNAYQEALKTLENSSIRDINLIVATLNNYSSSLVNLGDKQSETTRLFPISIKSVTSKKKQNIKIRYYKDALLVTEKALQLLQGSDHDTPEKANIYKIVGSIHLRLGKPHDAIESYNHAFNIDINLYPNGYHPSVVRNYAYLGAAWSQYGDYQTAIALYEKGLETGLSLYGEDDAEMLEIYDGLSAALKEVGKDESARKYRKRVMLINRKLKEPSV